MSMPVPLEVPPPATSRQSPDWTPTMVPLDFTVHFWLAPPVHAQRSTGVPGAVPCARDVEAFGRAVYPKLSCRGWRPQLVGAAVAGPDLDLRARVGLLATHVQAFAGSAADQFGRPARAR